MLQKASPCGYKTKKRFYSCHRRETKSSWSPSKLRPRLSEKTLTRPLSDVQMSRCWSSVTDFDVESVALIAGRGSSGREAYVAGNLEEKWVFYRRKKFIKFEEDWTMRLGTSGRRNACVFWAENDLKYHQREGSRTDFNVPQIAVEKTLGHSGREIKKKPKPLHWLGWQRHLDQREGRGKYFAL